MHAFGVRPHPRGFHVAAFDENMGRFCVHGGSKISNGFFDDLWCIATHESQEWIEIKPSGDKPDARDMHVAVYDSANKRFCVHGGRNGRPGGKQFLDDLWCHGPQAEQAWIAIQTSGNKPKARSQHVAAFDTVNNRFCVHGGRMPGVMGDLWCIGLTGDQAWIELTPSGDKPHARIDHVASFDSKTSHFLVHGGSYEHIFDDLWSFGSSAPMGAPSGLAEDALIWGFLVTGSLLVASFAFYCAWLNFHRKQPLKPPQEKTLNLELA